MKTELPFSVQRQVLHSYYENKRKREETAELVQGPDFRAFQKEIRHDEAQKRAILEKGTGCGEEFLLGWAGNSRVRCGAELTGFLGEKSILKCHECEQMKGLPEA